MVTFVSGEQRHASQNGKRTVRFVGRIQNMAVTSDVAVFVVENRRVDRCELHEAMHSETNDTVGE